MLLKDEEFYRQIAILFVVKQSVKRKRCETESCFKGKQNGGNIFNFSPAKLMDPSWPIWRNFG